MHATHAIDVKNHRCCTGAEKIIVKIPSSRLVDMNAVKNFLRNIKHIVSKDRVLFVKIKVLIMIKVRTNNLKYFYFIIIILHST